MSSAIASQAGQVLREMFKIPTRAREQVGSTWRGRFWQTGLSLSLSTLFKVYSAVLMSAEKPKMELLQTSLLIHRPIWIAGVAGTYTTTYACYLAMRYMRKLRH
jgi:hypothetical protein